MELIGAELAGDRAAGQVGCLAPATLTWLWTAATSRVVKYGFGIRYADLEPPRTGTFDGRSIVLDPDVAFEMQCFVLLHLFGHSVQWVAPDIEHKLEPLVSTKDKEEFLVVLKDYEYEAARFGLTLLHEAGIGDLDEWFADFVETDWVYVDGFYRTGSLPQWRSCIRKAPAPIEALAIPRLVHRDVQVRFAF